MSEIVIEKLNKVKQTTGTKQVMYRLKNTHTENVYDHILDRWTEREAYPAHRYIPNEYQTIKDGELVLIRYVEKNNINPETGAKVPVLGTIVFKKASGGVITCDLSTPKGLTLHNFLADHPNNESAPNRNPEEKVIFYKVDNNKEAEQIIETTVGYRDAMVKAFELDLAGLKMFARLIGTINVVGKSEAELRVIATENAMKDPKRFFEVLNDKDALVKVHIAEAEEKGIIVFDNNTKGWNWDNGVSIKVVGLNKPKDESLYDYFTTKAGSTQYIKLCELLENLKSK